MARAWKKKEYDVLENNLRNHPDNWLVKTVEELNRSVHGVRTRVNRIKQGIIEVHDELRELCVSARSESIKQKGWTYTENELLREHIKKNGTSNLQTVAHKLGRTVESVQLQAGYFVKSPMPVDIKTFRIERADGSNIGIVADNIVKALEFINPSLHGEIVKVEKIFTQGYRL